ncbi:MAG TPA: hypothetical protein VL095_12745 [Flavisolibacter sp.]|nr:hypothetical protein [Flavisolibacter sp.]
MNWKHYIKLQIVHHQNINLLADKQWTGFRFSQSTIDLIKQINKNKLSPDEETRLLQFAVEAALSSFYKVNQYYAFDKKAIDSLLGIYRVLVMEIKEKDYAFIDFDELADVHYSRLQNWLIQNYPQAVLIYPADKAAIHPVACAEYNAITQLAALGINEQNLKEPILDIGCGKEHRLVTYLKTKGYEAWGIDREAEPNSNILKKSWFEYEYGNLRWGTIISHLSFTNHFRHHHLKSSGDHVRYAKTFIAILKSLQVGGKFHYAPDLPFIELFLDDSQYQITKLEIEQTNFYASSIERIY